MPGVGGGDGTGGLAGAGSAGAGSAGGQSAGAEAAARGAGEWAPRAEARLARPESPARFETAFGTAEVTHANLNDGVVEGLRLPDASAFSVQYRPEAAPGPLDSGGLLAQFSQ